MANYQYDEGGSMASYFALTFLSLVLVPYTLSLLFSKPKTDADGCSCSLCLEQRQRIKKLNKRSLFSPKLGLKTLFLLGGWALFAFIGYKVANMSNESKVYNPFEILGIGSSSSEKEIRSHYKKLSLKFHPDKIKLAVNQTMEEVEAHFVNITKAYKSLTDPIVRQNWELFGNPDGRQEISMGIAIPKWVVEGQHRFIVLIGYCLVLGGLLPYAVGKWWFGSRQTTKDGVNAKCAAFIFKNIKEDSNTADLFRILGKGLEMECPKVKVSITDVEERVRLRVGKSYKGSPAQTLLYAHMLRLPLHNESLKKAQDGVLLRTPLVLSSLLNIALTRSWAPVTINAMRLHAYVTQAVLPSSSVRDSDIITQMPHIYENAAKDAMAQLESPDINAFIEYLREAHDTKADDATKAGDSFPKLELVDASFKVIGERIITPLSIIQLVIKARVVAQIGSPVKPEPKEEEEDIDVVKKRIRTTEERDQAFLSSKRDAEELTNGLTVMKRAHTPFWPAPRKPSWWVSIIDPRQNKLVIPPTKITDVPISDPSKERNYRTYKLQFQGPPQVAELNWKVHVVSDTFIGQEIIQDISLKIDDVSQLSAEEKGMDDEISEPDEDTLEGQMALMKGANVKRSPVHGESDDDEESSTDDDESSNSDSSSDSD